MLLVLMEELKYRYGSEAVLKLKRWTLLLLRSFRIVAVEGLGFSFGLKQKRNSRSWKRKKKLN